MFGFLKDKLKSWLGKSKKDIEEKAEKKKKSKPKIEKTKAKKEKPEKKPKSEKPKKTIEEIKEEREVTSKILSDIAVEKHEIKTPEEQVTESIEKAEITEESSKKLGFFEKLKHVFAYTLTQDRFEEIFADLETLLLESNVALEVVEKLKEELQAKLVNKQLKKEHIEQEITESLKEAINNILQDPEDLIEEIKDYKKAAEGKQPYVILFFGINGAGKTTSIAKISHLLKKHKLTSILAASDTFRAASIEQLQVHADRLGVPLIKHDYGSDPSAVAFDAIKYAKANNIDVVLVDTAGRMHTKENLLHEMEKICRVTKPNLKVFVAEAVAGNDATEQARAFNELIGVDGSILSKVDVDEKGGAIISVAYITKKPVLYLGIGQNYDDLELFNKKKFLERLGL